MQEKFVTQAAERGVPAADDRRRVQGVRAVRALRVQQGPRDVLRPDRVPDRVPQGELHGRVHDVGPDRVPGQRGEGRRRRRRVPPAGDRGPAAGRPPLGPRVHRRGRGDPVRAARRQERRRGRDRVDHRGPRGGRRVPLAGRLLQPGRPPAGQPQGPRVAGQGRRAQRVRPPGARSCSGSTTRSAAGQAAQRDRVTGQTSLFDMGGATRRPRSSGRCPATPETPGPRAAALGEGAAGAVPVGSPDGRGRGPGRAVRDRVLGRSQGRVARRAAGGAGRDRDRDADDHHQGQVDDGRGDARGPPGHARGGRVPADLRADARRRGATARSCWWPAGSTIGARRRRCWPTRCGTGTRSRSVAPRRSGARSGRWTGGRPAGWGRAGSNGGTAWRQRRTAASGGMRGAREPVAVGPGRVAGHRVAGARLATPDRCASRRSAMPSAERRRCRGWPRRSRSRLRRAPDLASASGERRRPRGRRAAAPRRAARGGRGGRPGAERARRGRARCGAQRPLRARRGHRAGRVRDAGVQVAAPRATRGDARRRPRARRQVDRR